VQKNGQTKDFCSVRLTGNNYFLSAGNFRKQIKILLHKWSIRDKLQPMEIGKQ
jgi:hypothetical protein